MSFGNKPSESNLVWKEKTPPSVNNQINKTHSSPVVRHATITPEAQQQLHEEILSELHDVTMKYVNVPDPVEREERRQRVLEGERHNLTVDRAASLLAQALNNQVASNQAFYANFEQEETSPLEENETVEPVAPTQHKKRGRPPGRQNTSKIPKPNVLRGTGSRKRNVQIIQNSPKVRKSYASQSMTTRKAGSRQVEKGRKPTIPTGPRLQTTTT